jgi:DNA-binding NarL/FixJ family response regulator
MRLGNCFSMSESSISDPVSMLSPRERQVADLLLEGCDNAEIAKKLKMARRKVKAHFNRMFIRFGIRDGIKRVKLLVMIYRARRNG